MLGDWKIFETLSAFLNKIVNDKILSQAVQGLGHRIRFHPTMRLSKRREE